jgi:hypothetical protein
MANLGKKGDTYCARFRLRGREYKKSLKTRDAAAARAALHVIELTLHRIHTGQLPVPARRYVFHDWNRDRPPIERFADGLPGYHRAASREGRGVFFAWREC